MINSKKHQSIVISSHVINTINSLPEEEKVAVATAFVSEMIMGVDPENALSPLQAMLYVLSQLGTADMHKVSKILYFADRSHLSKYARSITGDDYIKMSYGPVPSNVYDIMKAVRGDSFFANTSEAKALEQYFKFVNSKDIMPLMCANLDYLSESDVECLDEAIAMCKDLTFEELTRLSHDFAWTNTALNGKMSIKDMLCEVGDSEEYIEYVNHKMQMEAAAHGITI